MIVASFQSQYGIRLSRELKKMKWGEFRAMLVGIGPDTPLGRIVAIRAEENEEVIKHFSIDQRRIWWKWRERAAENMSQTELNVILEQFKKAFINMAGGEEH